MILYLFFFNNVWLKINVLHSEFFFKYTLYDWWTWRTCHNNCDHKVALLRHHSPTQLQAYTHTPSPFLSFQTSRSSSSESVLYEPMHESSVRYSSPAHCCIISQVIAHSVCSTQSVWYLLCQRESFTNAAYTLIICTASHVEICNHSLIEGLRRENT